MALLNYFLALCLLRAKPQDLPASGVLLLLTLLANTVVGVLVLGDAFGSPFSAFLVGLADNLLLLVFLWLLLRWRGWLPRLRQAATALFGSNTLLALLSYPLHLLVEPAAGQSTAAGVVGLFFLLVLMWVQVVMGHILRHALEVPLASGILLAVGFNLLSVLLIQGLFPVR